MVEQFEKEGSESLHAAVDLAKQTDAALAQATGSEILADIFAELVLPCVSPMAASVARRVVSEVCAVAMPLLEGGCSEWEPWLWFT